jgi:hypothetical protein
MVPPMKPGINKLPALLLFLSFLYPEYGCNTRSDKVSSIYTSYKFDREIIARVPVYDSLIVSIQEKITLFRQLIDTTDAYRVYRYIPGHYESGAFNQLPKEAGNKIDYFFTKLGADYIYRFDVFMDSTIKIYIRNGPQESNQVDVEENLSYYPREDNIQRRTYPAKDTMLHKHLQYWIRLNERRFF